MSFLHPVNGKLSQGFAADPAFYARYGERGHNGLDYAVPVGTPVKAADDGYVVFEGWGQKHPWMLAPAGICVILNNGGSFSGYAHLSRTVVDKGQKVTKGQVIGYSGATGAAKGAHLHFEMLPFKPNFKNGFAGRIDPTPYFDKPKPAPKNAIISVNSAKRQALITATNSTVFNRLLAKIKALVAKENI